MSYFNLSTYDNVTNIANVMTSANIVSDSWFSYLVIIVYYFILFLMFKSYDTKMIFFTSSVSLAVISSMLFFAEFVSINLVGVSVGLMAVSVVLFYWRSD